MNLIVDIIRRSIISPEFLVANLGVLTFIYSPNWLSMAAKHFSSSPEVVKYLAFIPVGVSLWCLQQSKTILFPADDSKGLLQEWPGFVKLKLRVLIGVSYQAIFCLFSILGWIITPKIHGEFFVVVVITSAMGSLIGAATFYFASLMVSEIIKRHATKSNI